MNDIPEWESRYTRALATIAREHGQDAAGTARNLFNEVYAESGPLEATEKVEAYLASLPAPVEPASAESPQVPVPVSEATAEQQVPVPGPQPETPDWYTEFNAIKEATKDRPPDVALAITKKAYEAVKPLLEAQREGLPTDAPLRDAARRGLAVARSTLDLKDEAVRALVQGPSAKVQVQDQTPNTARQCRAGHTLSPDNLITCGGERQCRRCWNDARNKRRRLARERERLDKPFSIPRLSLTPE
jgi:hypothetical protein